MAKQFKVPDHLKELAPQGYAVIRRKKMNSKTWAKKIKFRTTIFAENGELLQDSRQWFETLPIALQNLTQAMKAFGGVSVFVIYTGVDREAYFTLFADGTTQNAS